MRYGLSMKWHNSCDRQTDRQTDRQIDKGRFIVCSFVLYLLPQSIHRRGLTEASSGGTRLFASSWQGQENHAA